MPLLFLVIVGMGVFKRQGHGYEHKKEHELNQGQGYVHRLIRLAKSFLFVSLVLQSWMTHGQDKPFKEPVTHQPMMTAQQVTPGVYYVQGLSEMGSSANQNFISNAAFVVTKEGVVVIDALGSPELASRLLKEIRRITPLAIHMVILTHYHADHVYGLQVLKEKGAEIWAHDAAKEYLFSETAQLRLESSRQDLWPWIDENTHLIAADHWLTGPQNMTVGGVRFEIQPMGPSHTAEDLVIYLPDQKVLFAGDLVFRNRIPYVGQANSKHWIEALKDLLTFDSLWVIPGHGPMSSDPKGDMTLTRNYLIYLREKMGQAANDMEPFESAYDSTDWARFEKVPLFKAANRMNAYNTYILMEHEPH